MAQPETETNSQTHKIKPKERQKKLREIAKKKKKKKKQKLKKKKKKKKKSSSSICSTIPIIFAILSSRYRKKSQGHWTKRNRRPPSFVAFK